jgi:hypothetical protein
MEMTTVRKWRFPVLIGGGIVAAGVLVYLGNGHINSRATQGTIAHRDVYRDGEVKPGDVGTPGAVLESKDFQKLAKDQAFQEVLSDAGFQKLVTDQSFLALLKSASFINLAQNNLFRLAMLNPGVVADLRARSAQDVTVRLKADLLAAGAQDLNANASFNAVINSSAFSSLLRRSEFASVLARSEFGVVMSNAAFLRLASSSSFQNAMRSNSADLSNQLTLR